MAVNFTAYVKKTDLSSHLMQWKFTGPHTTVYGNWRSRPHAAPG